MTNVEWFRVLKACEKPQDGSSHNVRYAGAEVVDIAHLEERQPTAPRPTQEGVGASGRLVL